MTETTARERPIALYPWEVRAIQEGRKTQLRRPVVPREPVPEGRYEMRPDPVFGRWLIGPAGAPLVSFMQAAHGYVDAAFGPCPFGVPGDRLWGQETWAIGESCGTPFTFYRATDDVPRGDILNPGLAPIRGRWRRSTQMPRWASRFDLEIAEVRVERLQAISWRDALAEGISKDILPACGDHPDLQCYVSVPDDNHAYPDPIEPFRKLWDSINARRGLGWEADPFVWAISFRRVES